MFPVIFGGKVMLKTLAMILSSFRLGVMYFMADQEGSSNGFVATLASVGS